ncbi:MAG TPA: HAD-IA family hydrolase [Actinomycetota bacterium]|nr:HAD-IA family hydrolase [Actinomycetota bacterium]
MLFDAGDTLLAPAPSFQGRFVAVAAEQGVPLEEAAVDAAIAAAVRAAAWPDDWTDPATQRDFWIGFYQDVLPRLRHGGEDGMELAEALIASFSDPASYRLFDDVRPALDELAGRGITLGVVSNFEPWLADILALQGIDHLFATVAISGVLGVAKPDPQIFEAALAEARADPSATVHVGDQPANDVAAARAVGITPVLIDRYARYPEPDDAHRVEDLTGLVKLVIGQGSG